MNDSDKKIWERHVVKMAQRAFLGFPREDVVQFESPDWVYPSARLAIEVTDLVPERSARTTFSGPEVASFHRDVVARAEKAYQGLDGAAPVYVHAYFRNEFRRKKNVAIAAAELVKLVRANLPEREGDVVMLTLPESAGPLCGGGIRTLRIERRIGKWGHSDGAAMMSLITRECVERSIQGKQTKLDRYRTNLDRAGFSADGTDRPDCREWRFWLLIATRFPVLSNVQVPVDAARWQFRSDFDRILLVPCDGDGVEFRSLSDE